MTKTEIANIAIGLIGGKSLSNADTDTTAQAVSVRKFWELAINEALSSQPWNFASKRKRLVVSRVAISSVSNSSGAVRINATSHGLVTGDRADIQGVACASGSFFVTRIDDDNFDLQDSAYSSGYSSSGTFLKVPVFGWSFQHAVPADCVKARRVLASDAVDSEENDGEPFRIESGLILCNLETVNLMYTFRNVETATYPHEFIAAFSTLLASYLAQDLSGPAGRHNELRQSYEGLMLPNARGRDAREGHGSTPSLPSQESQLHAARY